MNTFRELILPDFSIYFIVTVFKGCGVGMRINIYMNVTEHCSQRQTHSCIDFDKSAKEINGKKKDKFLNKRYLNIQKQEREEKRKKYGSICSLS